MSVSELQGVSSATSAAMVHDDGEDGSQPQEVIAIRGLKFLGLHLRQAATLLQVRALNDARFRMQNLQTGARRTCRLVRHMRNPQDDPLMHQKTGGGCSASPLRFSFGPGSDFSLCPDISTVNTPPPGFAPISSPVGPAILFGLDADWDICRSPDIRRFGTSWRRSGSG